MRFAIHVGFALSLCAAPGPSAAQDLDVEALQDEQARGLFIAGRSAFAAGQYEQALEHFQRAHELSGRPELLFNIGVSAERLARDEEALAAFSAYLEALPGASNRLEVEARVRTLRDVRGAGSSDPGPWIVAGSSVASAIAGAVFLGLASSSGSTVESAEGVEWSSVQGDYDDSVFFGALGGALVAAGGLGLAVAIVWLAIGGDEEPAIALSPTGLTHRARF